MLVIGAKVKSTKTQWLLGSKVAAEGFTTTRWPLPDYKFRLVPCA